MYSLSILIQFTVITNKKSVLNLKPFYAYKKNHSLNFLVAMII